jgi:hypothetical protein
MGDGGRFPSGSLIGRWNGRAATGSPRHFASRQMAGSDPGSDVNDSDRYCLLDTYRTPQVRLGQRLRCAVLGEVTVVGYTDAAISWPVTRRGKWLVPIVTPALARAIRRESAQAIAYWWDVGAWTVWQWRKTLGVAATAGTTRLRSCYFREPWADQARAKAVARAGDAERRKKISEAHRGIPKPAHVVQAVIRAHVGTKHSAETRRKMSATHRRRGTMVPGTRPWTKAEDELLRVLPVREAVRQTGRTVYAVWSRRRWLGVPDGRQSRNIAGERGLRNRREAFRASKRG